MADNLSRYGFRYMGMTGGIGHAKPIKRFAASAANWDVTGGAQNIGLGAGDVVTLVNDGSITLCAGNETTPVAPWGVIMSCNPYYDSTIGQAGAMRYSSVVPSDVTYGTNLSRQTSFMVMPFLPGQLWEVDVDDATTATTEAAYQAFISENVSFINAGVSGQTRAYPKLDISSHATTATLFFRIQGIAPTLDNVDFSGANVKLLVEANVALNPVYQAAATGSTGV